LRVQEGLCAIPLDRESVNVLRFSQVVEDARRLAAELSQWLHLSEDHVPA